MGRGSTFCGLGAIALWSSLAVLTTSAAGIPRFELLALTFGLGGALGCLWLLRPGGPGLAALRQPPAAAALATAGLFAYHALYFVALGRAPAVEANLVNYLWPLLIVVFAAFAPGVKVGTRQWGSALLGLSAAALVVTHGQRIALDPRYAAGYLAAFGAAVTWAAYSVLNRRFGAVGSAAIPGPCLAVGGLGLAVHVAVERWVMPAPGQWLAIAAMAAGPLGAAFWLWDEGTKRGDIVLLGIASYSAPVFSTALLLAAGRGRPHWTHGVAVALLVCAGLLSVSRRQAIPPPLPRAPRSAPG